MHWTENQEMFFIFSITAAPLKSWRGFEFGLSVWQIYNATKPRKKKTIYSRHNNHWFSTYGFAFAPSLQSVSHWVCSIYFYSAVWANSQKASNPEWYVMLVRLRQYKSFFEQFLCTLSDLLKRKTALRSKITGCRIWFSIKWLPVCIKFSSYGRKICIASHLFLWILWRKWKFRKKTVCHTNRAITVQMNFMPLNQ